MKRERERKEERDVSASTPWSVCNHQQTDDGVDAETSLSSFLSLFISVSLLSLFSRAHYWVNKYILTMRSWLSYQEREKTIRHAEHWPNHFQVGIECILVTDLSAIGAIPMITAVTQRNYLVFWVISRDFVVVSFRLRLHWFLSFRFPALQSHSDMEVWTCDVLTLFWYSRSRKRNLQLTDVCRHETVGRR